MGSVIEDLSGREFELPVASEDELFAIGRPVGAVDVLEELSRGSARERRLREHTAFVEPQSQPAGTRDREETAGERKRGRFRAVGARRIEMARIPGPEARVHDRLSVRSEPRVVERSMPESDLPKERRRRRTAGE